MSTALPRSASVLLPGLLLIASSMLAPLIMVFHPTARGPDVATRLVSLSEISSLSRHVHLAMIVCVIGLWLSLAYVARRLPGSGWIWTAVRLYALGALAMLGAALISGFLIGEYLGRALPLMQSPEDALPSVLLAFSANQILAGVGTLLMSAGIALWSVAMVRERSWLAAACGYYGLLAGIGCLTAYATGLISLDVAGMTAVVLAQSLWSSLLGLWVVRTPTA